MVSVCTRGKCFGTGKEIVDELAFLCVCAALTNRWHWTHVSQVSLQAEKLGFRFRSCMKPLLSCSTCCSQT
jgi:hypothetical protein